MKYAANPVIVDAYKITAVGDPIYAIQYDHMVTPLTLEDGKVILATREQTARWTPQVGDYIVVQSDGYTYGNPKAVFERKYAPLVENFLSFGWAIEMMRCGHRVCRKGWNGKGMWLGLVKADQWGLGSDAPYDYEKAGLGNLLPWIGMKTADGKFVPWLASQTDMLANDWQIVE